ncbi:MAG: class I SAM-dependent methyltransferase [Acidimicrobiales bacterium]
MTDTAAHRGDPWEDHAVWWQREFTAGADPEYEEQIIPLVLAHLGEPGGAPAGGPGEGQLARAIVAATGARVVGVDPARAQVVEADRRGGGPMLALAASHRLPVADESIDAVVVCLVLEHVDELDGSFAELGRVLRPGGRLVLMLNHPLLQTPGSGMIIDHVLDPPETYWRIGPYLDEAETIEEVQGGVFVRFVHRPLARYVNAVLAAGLRIVRMEEPAPPEGFLATADEYDRDVVRTTPRLLMLVADKG